MFGKKLLRSMKKVKSMKNATDHHHHHQGEPSHNESLLTKEEAAGKGAITNTPPGMCPVYVGEERKRYVVPTSYLSHPLFKIMLDRAYDEFGFDQRNGLVLPCSVGAFEEVISAVRAGSNGKFDFGDSVDEFI